MLIGVPKEIKNNEYRVGLTPASVRELVGDGHEVFVETQAGAAIGFYDDQYLAAGAVVLANADEVFSTADLIIKVKEPGADEVAKLRQGQVLFTYLHLAPDRQLTSGLSDSGAVAIAYETVTDHHGGLPLLAPMSEVAGRLAVQAGAHALEMSVGGRGVLMGGVPGVLPAKVVVLGGGVAGTNAARMAAGMGADVTVVDVSPARLRSLDELFQGRLKTLYSTAATVEEQVLAADLVIGSVLVPGKAAPKLVSRLLVKAMKPGAVLVDVAIDQGGCFETSRPTRHDEATFIEHGVVHYCVTNMPGAVARTSTQALNNVTLPRVRTIARLGWRGALSEDRHLMAGLSICEGRVTCRAVAESQGIDFTSPQDMVRQ